MSAGAANRDRLAELANRGVDYPRLVDYWRIKAREAGFTGEAPCDLDDAALAEWWRTMALGFHA